MNDSSNMPNNNLRNMLDRKRDVTLDVLRVIACLLIIIMHSPMPGLNTSGIVLGGISYLTAPGIGLFFMVSGSLLLSNSGDKIFDTCCFLKRRFSRIIIPLIFWSIIGSVLDWCGIDNAEHGVLWFMYCLAGMYLLTPVLSRWLSMATVKEVEFYLLLWLFTLCVPFVKLFIPINESDTSWLYYFHGYVGYYVLGFYLKHYWEKRMSSEKKIVFSLLFLCISVVLPVGLKVLNVKVDFYSLFWYLSITVALQSVVWWRIVKRLMRNVPTLPGFVVELSKLSFGIYLVHILVMRNILWKTTWMQEMNGVVQIVVCVILTFTISALISWGISRIKYVKEIIGY